MEGQAGKHGVGSTAEKKRRADGRGPVPRDAGLGPSGARGYAYPRLSLEEQKAERIFLLLREGLGREQYLRAMEQLEQTREGQIAACYCAWLALREVAVCPESWAHWTRMRTRLALLLNEK